MTTLLDTRRYLTSFDSRRMSNILTDVLVVGSGVAGARAAIEAASRADVILMCKGRFEDCATRYAQGGIAAAKDDPDVSRHLQDTLRVGFGLNRKEAVEVLVREGPARLLELIDWGIELDRENGSLSFTREGGHSVNRIVHAQGDRTGEELVRTMQRRVRQDARIRVFDQCFLIDFLSVEGLCRGAVTFHPKYGHQLLWAKQTILASGGCGQIWRETTNPPVCTGDGCAAAFRAGARLRDMEFMQFHPTTLYVAGAGRTLISEAVRGEGAYLVDRAGKRFMLDHHPDGELAPRDIVSRVIHEHLAETRSNAVFLDVRHLPNFSLRFPGITELCAEFNINVRRDLIPVRPSAHYMIGGVEVNLAGESSFPGLFACGEAACTGVHGANRMASNSLLEGLVFGKIVGENAAARAKGMPVHGVSDVVSENPESPRTALDLADIRNSLASVMWRNVGIVRSGDRLQETGEILDFWAHYTLDKTFDDVSGWEMQNKLTVARLIAMCALERGESIGVHYRRDAKANTPSHYHTTVQRSTEGTAVARTEDWVQSPP
jgi:L-aspartate oxidase